MHIARAVESVIASTVRHILQSCLDILSLFKILAGVDEICSTELLTPLLFGRVDIDKDDLPRFAGCGALNNAETDTTATEDGDVGTLLDTVLASCDGGRTVASRDTAAKQTCAVHRCFGFDSDKADVGYNSVLRESRGTHEVQDIFTLALEPHTAVRHDALALRGPDFATEVGLARFAELALATLWSADGMSVSSFPSCTTLVYSL